VVNVKKDIVGGILLLLGVLNSTVVNFFFQKSFSGNNHIASNQLLQIPIPDVDSHDIADEIAKRVAEIIATEKELVAAKSAAQKDVIQRQIDATDREIDRLVYELYGLTDEEIAIVEEGAR
jgi:hypothetical protein